MPRTDAAAGASTPASGAAMPEPPESPEASTRCGSGNADSGRGGSTGGSTEASSGGSAGSCNTDSDAASGALAALPLELLAACVLLHLPPGERLRARAVSRRWAACVAGLAPHVNLVLTPGTGPDLSPYTGTLVPRASTGSERVEDAAGGGSDGALPSGLSSAGGGAIDTGEAADAVDDRCAGGSATEGGESRRGLLASRFPAVRGLRLWVGCTPPASVGAQDADRDGAGEEGRGDQLGGDGGPRDAAANRATLRPPRGAAHRRLCTATAGPSVPLALGIAGVSTAWKLVATTRTAVTATALFHLAAVVIALGALLWRRRWRAPLAAGIAPQLSVGRKAGAPGHAAGTAAGAPGHAAGTAAGSPEQPSLLIWRAEHTGRVASSYLLAASCRAAPQDAAAQRLSAWLPPLGGSERLTALSLVTAAGVTCPDLQQLAVAFPRLRALALHAHQPVGATRTCTVPVTSLEPLRPVSGGPAHETAAGPQSGPRSSLSAAGSPSVVLCGAKRGPNPPGLGLNLRSLVLSGVRCEWPDGGQHGGGSTVDVGTAGGGAACGLAALTGLRSLVLHRTVGRMYRLLPQIRTLTQLTRLELLDLDYHHAVPLDAAELGVVAARAAREARRWRRWMAAREAREQRRRLRQAAETGAGGSRGGGALDDEESSGSDAQRFSSEDDGEEEEGEPWVSPPSFRAPGGSWPHWHPAMRALGRVVRALPGLRVLTCEVECPLDDSWQAHWKGPMWPPLLSALECCPGLESLSLPGLRLASVAQARSLAAAAPQLTRLELGALPPVGRERRRRLTRHEEAEEMRRAEAERQAALADLARLRPHYLTAVGGAAAAAVAAGSDPCVSSGAQPTTSDSESAKVRLIEASQSDGSAGSVDQGDGCLSAFRRLRRLTLRCPSVAQLSAHLLPLPPRLEELSTPLWHSRGPYTRLGEQWPLAPGDLLLLHTRLLPALRPLRAAALAPGPCGRGAAPLLAAMLGSWLGACVTQLDLSALTYPGHVDAGELRDCLRLVADAFPRLRRLRCHLWAARGSLFPPAGPPGDADGPPDAAAPPPCPRAGWLRGVFRRGEEEPAEASNTAGGGDAGGVPLALVDCINDMPALEQLDLQVMAIADWAVPPLSRSVACPAAYHPHRAPLELLLALRRPLRLVDCSPLECWCSPDASDAGGGPGPASSADPRVVLAAARAALAARGWHGVLTAEVEERAAGAMGLGPEREAAWRGEALGG